MAGKVCPGLPEKRLAAPMPPSKDAIEPQECFWEGVDEDVKLVLLPGGRLAICSGAAS